MKTPMMGDLKNPKWIYLKGFLFLVLAVASCGLILYEFRNPRLMLLLAIAIWASARFYYFAFYVIEHYVDPNYKFAGLGAFVMYLLRGGSKSRTAEDQKQIAETSPESSEK